MLALTVFCTSNPWQQFSVDVLELNVADADSWYESIVLAVGRRMSVKFVLINISLLIQSPRRPRRFLGDYRVRSKTEVCDYQIHSSIRLYVLKCQGRRSWLPQSLINIRRCFIVSPLTSSYLHRGSLPPTSAWHELDLSSSPKNKSAVVGFSWFTGNTFLFSEEHLIDWFIFLLRSLFLVCVFKNRWLMWETKAFIV